MRPLVLIACVAGAGTLGAAAGRADERTEETERTEKRVRVRASATVEVIDDAHHVDDIISRLKSSRAAPAGARTEAGASTAPGAARGAGTPSRDAAAGAPSREAASGAGTSTAREPVRLLRDEALRRDRLTAPPPAARDEVHHLDRPT